MQSGRPCLTTLHDDLLHVLLELDGATELPQAADQLVDDGLGAADRGAQAGAGAVEPRDRGLHSFRFQLNLSSSVHRVTQLNS